MQTRKKIRLNNYDYSTLGYYFITICTENRRNYFWKSVGADNIRPQMTEYGKVAETSIKNIPKHYANVKVDKYCIMPNHIHMILIVCGDENGRIISAPTLSTVIGSMKRYVSRQIGHTIWQKSFYDEIIRNTQMYCETWQYINDNPMLFKEDPLCKSS